MNNLHRELAPVSEAAWDDLEAEVRRTFTRHLAGRRLVDVPDAEGATLAAISTGHTAPIDPPAPGVTARLRRSQPLVELRVPFTVDRRAIDDVERGAKDPDWQPAKDAARLVAFAEDRAIFEGYASAGIHGIRASSDNAPLTLPAQALDYPDSISQAITALRLAGVDGPYSLALSADAYTAVNETSDHGYPIHEHLARLIDGEIIWAPAITGAFLLTTRGGDYELRLGQDLSIGYQSHDATSVELYLQESFTFLTHTSEASVALS
ncbi:MAG: hypothetical protein QOF84_682 [Streptomyces sp.]|nr:hypothetical protein [Streptomyces sp.]